jgi:hypothetical protein
MGFKGIRTEVRKQVRNPSREANIGAIWIASFELVVE